MCEFIGTETNRCEALEQVKIERDNLVTTITTLRRDIDEAKGWLKEAREGWAGSDAEFTEAYGELCEMLGVELTETVEVSVTLTQTIKVKKPIGQDIDESDFYTRSYVHILSNSDEVEVEDHTDDASIDEVEVL
jgi:hypothetical protein